MVDSIDVRKRYSVSGRDIALLDLYVDQAMNSGRTTDIPYIRATLNDIIDNAKEVM